MVSLVQVMRVVVLEKGWRILLFLWLMSLSRKTMFAVTGNVANPGVMFPWSFASSHSAPAFVVCDLV